MSTATRFTIDEFDTMVEHGVFDDRRDVRLELIYGEILEMTPPGPPHEDTIDLLTRWSTNNTSEDEVRVRIQNSVGIPEIDSVPMPDVAWVREQSYRQGRPQPSDVLLLIEVASSSLEYDRGVKARLYAAAGIQDYWIVNLRDLCVEVYREPLNDDFREKRTYQIGEQISCLQLPSITLDVSQLFPN